MNKIDELLKIKELLDSGIISEKEFQELKKNLLSVSGDVNQEEKKINYNKYSEEIKSDKAKNLESEVVNKDNSLAINKNKDLSIDNNINNLFEEKNKSKNKIYVVIVLILMIVFFVWYNFSYEKISNNKNDLRVDTISKNDINFSEPKNAIQIIDSINEAKKAPKTDSNVYTKIMTYKWCECEDYCMSLFIDENGVEYNFGNPSNKNIQFNCNMNMDGSPKYDELEGRKFKIIFTKYAENDLRIMEITPY